MFTSKNTNAFSASYRNYFKLDYFKWVKLLFVLTLFATVFSACTKDDEEDFTPEQIEEERIETEIKGLAGTWEFASSKITTPLAPTDSLDYRDIKLILGAISPVNGSEIELNSDGTYKFTNFEISGGSYVLSGKWEYRNDSTFQTDVIQLKGLYNQLLNRLDVDREFFTPLFADSFENFQVGTKTNNEIQLSNKGIIVEPSNGAEPKNIGVEGTYTITRKK